MRARVVNLNADGRVLGWRCSVPAGSVAEEFREFVLSRRIGVEDECSVGVEGEFRCLPGGFVSCVEVEAAVLPGEEVAGFPIGEQFVVDEGVDEAVAEEFGESLEGLC
jgi:hypothetical protein